MAVGGGMEFCSWRRLGSDVHQCSVSCRLVCCNEGILPLIYFFKNMHEHCMSFERGLQDGL